jgi:hypothetical protein
MELFESMAVLRSANLRSQRIPPIQTADRVLKYAAESELMAKLARSGEQKAVLLGGGGDVPPWLSNKSLIAAYPPLKQLLNCHAGRGSRTRRSEASGRKQATGNNADAARA